MNFSCFNFLGVIFDLDLAFSRLNDIYKLLDSSQIDAFYDDLCALCSFVDSICDKYSKN